MAFELLRLTFGVVVGLPGLLRALTAVLFYTGQRRELYFEERSEFEWFLHGFVPLLFGSVASCLACSMITSALSFSMCANIFVLTAIFITIFPTQHITAKFQPRWVRQLEATRSELELKSLCEVGRIYLRKYPRVFRRLINTQDGWESWLLTLTQQNPIVHFEKHAFDAEDALAKREFSRAHFIAGGIIIMRPDHALGYQLRARALVGKHQFAEALQDYDRCIQIEPRNVDFYYRRARVHLILDQMESALADLQTAADLQPGNERLSALRDIAARRQRQLPGE